MTGPGGHPKSHPANNATSGIWWLLYCGNSTHSFSCFLESPCPRKMAPHLAPQATCKVPWVQEKGNPFILWTRAPPSHVNPPESYFFPSHCQDVVDEGWATRSVTWALEESLNICMFIVHIFTDSLVVANGSTVWSNQQAQTTGLDFIFRIVPYGAFHTRNILLL